MKHAVHLTTVCALLVLMCAGCSDTVAPTGPEEQGGADELLFLRDGGENEPLVVAFIANGRLPVGEITVSNDGTDLCVDFSTDEGWLMRRTQVAYGHTLDDLPLTPRGRVGVGQFPISQRHQPPVSSATHCFNWAEQGFAVGDTILLVANGFVVQTSPRGWWRRLASAWGEGARVHKRGWAMVFGYVIQDMGGPEPCTLEMVWPNGYENMCVYDVETIVWESAGGCADTVTLELFQDGELCHVIAEDVPNTGAYEWEFSETCPGDMAGYTVRVSDPASGTYDDSDAPFTLEDCGGGGESW